jgi:hypothetical protein
MTQHCQCAIVVLRTVDSYHCERGGVKPLLLLSLQREGTAINMNGTVVVTTKQGKLKGKKVMTANGVAYYSFKGIPYAKPPIGALRFKVSSILHELHKKFKITPPEKKFHEFLQVKSSWPCSENLPFNFPNSIQSSLYFQTLFI